MFFKNHLNKLGLVLGGVLLLLLFQNLTSAVLSPSLAQKYNSKISSIVDEWANTDLPSFSTGHICKPSSVSNSINNSYVGKPYLTPKIHRLAQLTEALNRIYPYLEPRDQKEVLQFSKNFWFWIYKQIDWSQKLVADDYGACYKGSAKVYSHLTTPLVLMALNQFRLNLNPTDPTSTQITKTIETLALSQLNSVDQWMTPIDHNPLEVSANYMAINLSTLAVLNDVNPNSSYLLAKLSHRVKTDYAWIRTSFINYSSEQSCNIPLLYGGWSHQTPQKAAAVLGISFSCDLMNQNNSSSVAKNIRSYYLQKVSYHTIIMRGLSDLLRTLNKRQSCDLVKYGSNGTCSEIRSILMGANSWLFKMINTKSNIPAAFASFPIDEFGYFTDSSGTIPGIAMMIEAFQNEKQQSKLSDLSIRFGFIDRPDQQGTFKLSAIKNSILKTTELAIESGNKNNLVFLGIAPYLVEGL